MNTNIYHRHASEVFSREARLTYYQVKPMQGPEILSESPQAIIERFKDPHADLQKLQEAMDALGQEKPEVLRKVRDGLDKNKLALQEQQAVTLNLDKLKGVADERIKSRNTLLSQRLLMQEAGEAGSSGPRGDTGAAGAPSTEVAPAVRESGVRGNEGPAGATGPEAAKPKVDTKPKDAPNDGKNEPGAALDTDQIEEKTTIMERLKGGWDKAWGWTKETSNKAWGWTKETFDPHTSKGIVNLAFATAGLGVSIYLIRKLFQRSGGNKDEAAHGTSWAKWVLGIPVVGTLIMGGIFAYKYFKDGTSIYASAKEMYEGAENMLNKTRTMYNNLHSSAEKLVENTGQISEGATEGWKDTKEAINTNFSDFGAKSAEVERKKTDGFYGSEQEYQQARFLAWIQDGLTVTFVDGTCFVFNRGVQLYKKSWDFAGEVWNVLSSPFKGEEYDGPILKMYAEGAVIYAASFGVIDFARLYLNCKPIDATKELAKRILTWPYEITWKKNPLRYGMAYLTMGPKGVVARNELAMLADTPGFYSRRLILGLSAKTGEEARLIALYEEWSHYHEIQEAVKNTGGAAAEGVSSTRANWIKAQLLKGLKRYYNANGNTLPDFLENVNSPLKDSVKKQLGSGNNVGALEKLLVQAATGGNYKEVAKLYRMNKTPMEILNQGFDLRALWRAGIDIDKILMSGHSSATIQGLLKAGVGMEELINGALKAGHSMSDIIRAADAAGTDVRLLVRAGISAADYVAVTGKAAEYTQAAARVARTQKWVTGAKWAGRGLAVVGLAAEGTSYYLSEYPELVRRLEETSDLAERERLQQEMEYKERGLGISTVLTAGCLFPPTAVPASIIFGAKSLVTDRLNDSVNVAFDYMIQTQRMMAQNPAGNILAEIAKTAPGSMVSWGQRVASIGITNRMHVANARVRQDGYRAYFSQLAASNVPLLTAKLLSKEELSESGPKIQQRLMTLQSDLLNIFSSAATQYIGHATANSFVSVDCKILQRAEMYGRLAASENIRYLTTRAKGEKYTQQVPLLADILSAEEKMRSTIEDRLNNAIDQGLAVWEKQKISSIINAVNSGKPSAQMRSQILMSVYHDLAKCEERVTSTNYSNMISYAGWRHWESDESLRQIARGAFAKKIVEAIVTIERIKLQSPNQWEEILETVRAAMSGNPDTLALQNITAADRSELSAMGAKTDLLTPASIMDLLPSDSVNPSSLRSSASQETAPESTAA